MSVPSVRACGKATALGVIAALAAFAPPVRAASPDGGATTDGAAAPAGRAADARIIRRERRCMGTLCSVTAFHADEAAVTAASTAAFDEMDRLEALMTTWRETSDVSRINAAAGQSAVAVAPETFEVIEKALWVARLSGGRFDITTGVFAGLWKFDEDNDGTVPARDQVRARRGLVDYRDVIIDVASRSVRLRRKGQKINLGGIAKGFIVDAGVRRIRRAGLRDFLVQAGGDLFAAGRRGDRDWIVGIQDPRAPRELPKSGATSFALLSLSDKAFNTSGDYERFIFQGGRRYHHILDPRSGYPVTHTRAVTVLAPSAFLADALDTAIFIMGVRAGMKLVEELPDVEAVIVDARNQVHVSSGLSGTLKVLRQPSRGL